MSMGSEHAQRPQEETFSNQIDMGLWKRLWGFTKPYRREVGLLVLCAVGTASTDVSFPLLTRDLIDRVEKHGLQVPLWPYALGYLALAIGLATFIVSFIYLAGKIRSYVNHDIRQTAFENLQRLTFSYFDRRPVGWLMARMTSDCERLSQIMAWGVLDLVWGITLMTGIAVVMAFMNLRLAAITLIVVPMLWLVSTWFAKRILYWARIVRKTNSRITASYNEGIMGTRTTKSFAREPENLKDFSKLTHSMYDASVRNALYTALFLPLVLTIASVATGLALSVGGWNVTRGVISVGTLVAFLVYTRHFFEPINQIANWFAEMQMAQASAERVMGIIQEVPEIADGPHIVDSDPDDDVEEIQLRDVGFAYQGGQTVLENFNLTVRAGETIALVGATGGGKSTIVNLICRFYEPTAGQILINGVDYRNRPLEWLHSKLGIVLQTPHLFGGTIADNIRYGNRMATDEEVREASKLAGAHELIMGLKSGYETRVGEGGVLLSTGEKQLVSFARALLAQPSILVMDEATSSVDTETEQRIQRGMAVMLAGRTSFVIAHRLSTIRAADRILVIDDGEIVEQGSHAQLLERGGRYHDLYTQQRLRAEVMGHLA